MSSYEKYLEYSIKMNRNKFFPIITLVTQEELRYHKIAQLIIIKPTDFPNSENPSILFSYFKWIILPFLLYQIRCVLIFLASTMFLTEKNFQAADTKRPDKGVTVFTVCYSTMYLKIFVAMCVCVCVQVL